MRALDIIRLILFPFIPFYTVLVGIRNYMFNTGRFKSVKVNAFVVSVGNLTIGGSGKTPFTIYITSLLKKMNRKVAVLSRGYGRKTKGYHLVSDGKKVLVGVEEGGDEMIQTALECEVPSAVCENRVFGAKKLIVDFDLDCLVLDDAFQHRWIARDLDLVLIDQRFLTQHNPLRRFLLPTGNLREPFDGIKRADCIIINRKFSHPAEIPVKFKSLFGTIRTFSASYIIVGFIDVRKDIFYPADEFQGQKSLLVCGIANPHSFITALQAVNISTGDKLIFKDHKLYSNNEVQLIRKTFYDRNSYSVITTQKDAVKLSGFSKELDDIDIYYLKIGMKLDEEQEFEKYLKQKMKEHQ